MLLILVFGLMSTMIIPSCEGNKWIGTFKNPGSCDLTKCCCPSGDLNIVNDAGNVKGSFPVDGTDCKTSGNRTITVTDLNANSTIDASVGTFLFDGTLNKLDVTLDQKTPDATCKVTMARLVTGTTVIINPAGTTPVNNNSAGGGATNVGGGGATTNAGNADTTTKPKPSKASLNHDTNLIKILSIMMAIVTIIHV
ncbi:unnamed protein product [Adineta steineri]|uniref:Uncharacterized protein n=1 Tax=Adineta steineri TaxID=433720 RepID=A0A814BR71_9BILA|nr:unnamed protein product [Adineta steineri]